MVLKSLPVNILFLMATQAEYGDAMKALGIAPHIIGVGPIQAAVNTTALLKDLAHKDRLPDLVVNIGSAGSNRLDYETVAQASHVAYRDMDASPFGFARGQTPFCPLPAKLPIDIRIPGLPVTTVSTGAGVISGKAAYDSIDEDCVEMEAYAVYTACIGFGIPMIKIVGISDGREDLSGQLHDWTRYLSDIDRGFAKAVGLIEDALSQGTIAKTGLRLPDFA